MTLEEAFKLAASETEKGNFANAESVYMQILRQAPENKTANLLLSQLQSKLFENGEFVAAEGNRSASDNGSYVACVLEATRSYKAFSVFKQDPRFRRILEHTSKEQGEEYLAIVKRESPDFISHFNAFKENDLVGDATTYDYPDVGKVSPSTLRYTQRTGFLLRS